MEEKSLKRIVREELSKLSELSWKERIGYVWDYYKPLMVAVLAVIVLVHLGITIYHNKQIENLLSVYMVNCNSFSVDSELIAEDIAERMGGLEEKQEITVDTSISISDSVSQSALAYQMKLATLIAAGEIDILLLDADTFETYAAQDTFLDLTEVLTGEELEKWEDLLVYRVVETDETDAEESEGISEASAEYEPAETGSEDAAADELSGNEGTALALDVTASAVLNSCDAYYGGTVYAAVVLNTEHTAVCSTFFEYLLDE